jgi:putative ABC transport system permease protein
MATGAAVRRLLAVLRGASRLGGERELDDEIREHLRLLTERYVRHGMTRDEATRAARRQFGNTTLLREDRRQMQTFPTLESMWRDVRQAARMLRRSPGFAAGVVLTLALAIGGTTTVFSVYSAVLLKPLPYADPDRIVMLWDRLENATVLPDGTVGPVRMPVAPANFIDWRKQARAFSDVAALNPFPMFVLRESGDPLRLSGAAVSWNFFRLLGTPLAMGRAFLPEEDQPGRNRVAILSHAAWVNNLGADPNVLGRTIGLNDVSFTVVGVLPQDFRFIGKPSDFQARNQFDVWVPLALNPSPSRGTHPLRVFARLNANVTRTQAQAELDVIATALARAYPEDNKGRGIDLVPLLEQVTAGARPALRTLLAAVGFVLLIACANVANLLLGRGTARQRELAVRVAIGARRRRIARQLLAESLLLALLGGAIGLLLALVTIRSAVPYLPADLSLTAVRIDAPVLAFTLLLSLATGILFGLAPLLQLGDLRANDALSRGTRVAGGLQTRLRSLLVVGQVAITLVLLVGGGLMARSLWTLTQVPTGFRTENVLTARVTMPRPRYPDAGRVGAFQRTLLERLRNTAGIESAGMTAYLPLSGDDNGWAFFIEGRPPKPLGVFDVAKYRAVSDGYFAAIGMPLVRGRDFTTADDDRAPLAVVINESMARTYWGPQNPVGQRLRFGGPAWRTVIGVVGDVRHEGLDGDLKPEMYVPFAQAPNVETVPTVVVRTVADPVAMTGQVRNAVSAIDGTLPVDQIRTMEQVVSASVQGPRFRTMLLVVLAVLALMIASMGVYSVTSYSVTQRTRELGIYQAIGATPGDVRRMVLGRTTASIAMGIGLGLLGSFALTRLMAGFLFGVDALDPPTFAGVTVLVLAIASLAGYIPARRATRIDPMAALRYE